MANDSRRQNAARWRMKKDVHYVLTLAKPEEIERLRELRFPLSRAFNRYHPATAFELKQTFWQDCRTDGVTAALESWAWILN